MSERFHTARERNLKRDFEAQVLILLERIAVALENKPPTEYIDPIGREAEADEIYYDQDAIVCRCGNDTRRYCAQCTPARLAWFYNQNPTYRP